VFQTSFSKRTTNEETVLLELEADGTWRVIGYTIAGG